MAEQESFGFGAAPKLNRSTPAGRKPARGKMKPGSGGRRKSTRRKPSQPTRKRSTRKQAPASRGSGESGATSGAGSTSGGGSRPPTGQRATAADLAKKQRDISVSEFFAKNRHLLGFDNPSKALLTTVKVLHGFEESVVHFLTPYYW